MNEFKIIHKPSDSEPFIVIYKPHNIPSAPLNPDDTENALAWCIKKYPEIKNVKGIKPVEYGLVHRIDTVTDGLLLIAVTQDFYNHIEELQKKNLFKKYYLARCIKQIPDTTFPKFQNDFNNGKTEQTLETYFRPFGKNSKEVRPVTKNSGPSALKKVGKPVIYSTNIKLVSKKDEVYTFLCGISKGFRHQVRCHLAAIGFPVINDPVYNKNECTGDIQFTACKIEFSDEKGSNFIFEL